ncbi:hypothetical protein DPEC_G00099240 [Dallia pectoralis]|uniref:Uncharacterized protein n=1 Tax=Dallia pectoralis TaxID=75939 RepID=A0ACC2GWT0_DALPE|nr:hypothetical protein DPEC_G00099240 [Dallia pectoralis]
MSRSQTDKDNLVKSRGRTDKEEKEYKGELGKHRRLAAYFFGGYPLNFAYRPGIVCTLRRQILHYMKTSQ